MNNPYTNSNTSPPSASATAVVNVFPSYPEMLKSVKQAKKTKEDTFEYFLRSAVGSGAYRLGSRMIECRENVAGMTLIFICSALLKFRDVKNKREMVTEELSGLLRNHLGELKRMRTRVSLPLCVVPEEEGVIFLGEGMSLRFLNALIILESLLLAKMTLNPDGALKDNWSLYSPLDLMIYLELPALLGVLDDSEMIKYAASIKEDDVSSLKCYEDERRTSASLILSLSNNKTDDTEKTDDNNDAMMKFFGIILFLLYTIIVIKIFT